VTADTDGVTAEAGAAFEDLAVLRDALVTESGVPGFTEIVGRTDGDTTTYVRVTVDSDASEADVRERTDVGEETTVHMPGEWDREFPEMDTDRAEAFLNGDGSSQWPRLRTAGRAPRGGVARGVATVTFKTPRDSCVSSRRSVPRSRSPPRVRSRV